MKPARTYLICRRCFQGYSVRKPPKASELCSKCRRELRRKRRVNGNPFADARVPD